ncbi:MAG: type IX secretion system sortase PorU [Muribaculaceae bacterium]|nr:type IX secretion system sortase PorU [Muribaculaceae bacterium]
MTTIFKKTASVVLAALLSAAPAMAFSSGHFAKKSKLAQGKWVKIAVNSTGVYELTDAELLAMGFSNPANVQVYGMGGNIISEILSGDYPDDLQPVSVQRYNGKLCFYALGPTTFNMVDARTETPRYTRTINPYSTMGYYFLNEEGTQQTVDQKPVQSKGSVMRPTSLGFTIHENDLISVGFSGKEMMGEDIVGENFNLDYTLPGIADSTLTVNVAAAVNSTDYEAYLRSKVITDRGNFSVPFTLTQSRFNRIYDGRTFYREVSPVAKVTTTGLSEQGKLNVSVYISGTPKMAKLNYFIINYTKHNTIIDGQDGQTMIGIPNLTTQDCIVLPGASESTVVWNVDEPSDPIQYTLSQRTDDTGAVTGYDFTPRMSVKSAQYVAFDPTQTLKKISGFEPVENQNLHALPTPDMLIITNKAFMEQAQRIADMHKQVDNLDVVVVDQQEVFNEFSSGTPDAMAYRLMCKMFYDRDKTKFKSLILFGPGSYDNRGLVSNKANRLLTYQSDRSDDKDNSFASDDFFGFLDDESGSSSSLKTDMLRIGVGRYPVTSVEEAKADVDKLIKYCAAPDYGPWRNDVLINADVASAEEADCHIFEAEGINNLIENDLNTQMNTNKVYVEMFQRSIADGTTSTEARRRFVEYLQDGQYFMTYVGHAGPLVFTKTKFWTSVMAQTTVYPHWPIMTTACCEVARYDSDQRGIAEFMFHKSNGGVIAMVGSPRESYNDQNDIMNNAFVRALFSYKAKGYMPTLGEAYRNAKQNYGYARNGNKLSFTLFGDPAIKINYPKPLFDIVTINNKDIDNLTAPLDIAPMQEVTVTAQVNKEDGSGIDTDFTGDATLTLYDAKRELKTVSGTPSSGGSTVNRTIYYPRDILARVQGRVVNGVFTGKVIMPRHFKGLNESAMMRIYAHKDNSDQMVNGQYEGLNITTYNEATAVNDDNAPVIDAMFLNDEQSFTEGGTVPANSTLYINASDDVSINTMSASVGGAMKLMLDGGKSTYYLVKNYATTCDEGRQLSVAFPLEGINPGVHTLTFTVFDVAGHSATRTISFIVGETNTLTLTALETPAVDKATFSISGDTTPTVNLKVTDAQGNLVWTKTTATFPLTWDLKDNAGNRVKPGLYKFFGNFDDGTNYGGTNIGDLIVIDPVKSNK